MNPDRRPLVLFRTPFFGANPVNDIVGHELQDRFTFDQDLLGEADVVVFHVPELRWAKIGNTPKYPGQVWVAWSMESNINYPELSDPSFMSAFDLSMTYERSADIWLNYIPSPDSWRRASQSAIPPKTASAPVVTFQTASHNKSGRNDFTAELMRHAAVHSYGKHLRNCRLPEPDLGRQTKLQTIAYYHFCLAFENSVAPDYVTE